MTKIPNWRPHAINALCVCLYRPLGGLTTTTTTTWKSTWKTTTRNKVHISIVVKSSRFSYSIKYSLSVYVCVCVSGCCCYFSFVLFTSFVWVTRQKMWKKQQQRRCCNWSAASDARNSRVANLSALLLVLLFVLVRCFVCPFGFALVSFRIVCFMYFASECTLHFCGLASFRLDWPRRGQVQCQQTEPEKNEQKSTFKHSPLQLRTK